MGGGLGTEGGSLLDLPRARDAGQGEVLTRTCAGAKPTDTERRFGAHVMQERDS